MPLYTIVATSVSEGSDEAELDLLVDEFSVEAEAVGYSRRMADETRGMAEQLKLDFEYSNVCLYTGDVSEEQPDPSHPSLVGMWWFSEDGAEWADAAALNSGETDEAADDAPEHPNAGAH